MTDGCLDKCPIYDDVTTFVPTGPASGAEAVSAGWPCQVAASVSARWHRWKFRSLLHVLFEPLTIASSLCRVSALPDPNMAWPMPAAVS